MPAPQKTTQGMVLSMFLEGDTGNFTVAPPGNEDGGSVQALVGGSGAKVDLLYHRVIFIIILFF